MATSAYLSGRKRYNRPQGIIWSNNPGQLSNGSIVPMGVEGQDFIILSDHGRTEMSFSKQRIENRKRMINGGMRSYHIADKQNVSWSWEMLPSRSHSGEPIFSTSTGKQTSLSTEYTADGGAGGVDLISWYEENPGPFYMFLAYDRFDKFDESAYSYLGQYNDVLNVFFSSFDYNVVRRGSTNTHDFFDIDVSLEEV
jgi:hypothetical protein